MLPCDEEEQDRLDLFHKLTIVARASLIKAPHPIEGRFFLDLGCGTGIWDIDVAKTYAGASVTGVDLAFIQPPNRPDNCAFLAPFDFESPWPIERAHGISSICRWPVAALLVDRVFIVESSTTSLPAVGSSRWRLTLSLGLRRIPVIYHPYDCGTNN